MHICYCVCVNFIFTYMIIGKPVIRIYFYNIFQQAYAFYYLHILACMYRPKYVLI